MITIKQHTATKIKNKNLYHMTCVIR